MKRTFYFLAIILAFVACENDDDFSTSTGLRLTFPEDTLKMDTVFSRTPSSTYTFWVYNENDQGIRLQSVRLRRGNQTGFRVNVDGIYLDNSIGSQTSDVEIRKNDSILVFVELTPAENGQKSPMLVEDDLLFLLESGVEQKVCLQAWSWDAKKLYSPVITKDTLIESELPIVIFGDMKVEEGVELTIRNTCLYFHDSSGLQVYGTLHTEDCVLRGDRLDDMFDYLPYDRVSGQWNGVHLYETSTGNTMLRTEIRNPLKGIVCDSAAIAPTIPNAPNLPNDPTISTTPRLSMTECIIHNCEETGLEAYNAYISLDHCQLTNTGGDCISVVGGIADISYCTFAQFYPFTASRGAAFRFSNRYDETDIPLQRLSCVGSIMTGYDEDVVMGVAGSEEVPFNYDFRLCLMRTPAVTDDSLHFEQILWETPKDSIQGKQHFVQIDEDNLIYDFHLDSLSTAQGLGCY